jgi:hypothetical protein
VNLKRSLLPCVSLLSFILLAACAPVLPTIITDEAHFTAFKHGEFQDAYVLAPAPGFTVDATNYAFVIPAEAPEVPGPNMIQLTTGDGLVYSHPWDLQFTRYDLNAKTLTGSDPAQPFPGLQDGESYLLGIGYLDAAGRFTVLWAAVVDVRAR